MRRLSTFNVVYAMLTIMCCCIFMLCRNTDAAHRCLQICMPLTERNNVSSKAGVYLHFDGELPPIGPIYS